MAFDKRQQAERSGRRAEGLAALLLRLKGYRIVAKRYRVPVGEIDLIAQKGKAIVFIEVKARKSLQAAKESVTTKQQARIRAAAQLYLQKSRLASLSPRFDVILLAPGRLPRHIRNAWI